MRFYRITTFLTFTVLLRNPWEGHHNSPTPHHLRANHARATPGSRRSGQTRGRCTVLDRLPIRAKIALVLLLPALACGVLAGLRVSDSIATSRQAERVRELTEFSLRGAALAHELQRERGLAHRFLLGGTVVGVVEEPLSAQHAATDQALADWRASAGQLDPAALPEAAAQQLTAAASRLEGLADLRRDISTRTVDPPGALAFYDAAIAGTLNANRELARTVTDPELAQRAGVLVATSRLKELVAIERELVLGMLAGGRPSPAEYQRFTSTIATRAVLLSELRATATPEQRAIYVETVVGPEVQRASELEADVVASEGSGRLDLDPTEWWLATTTQIDLLHEVEGRFGAAAGQRGGEIQAAARTRATRDTLAVAAVLALAVGLSFLVARSMLRRLRELKAAAAEVATTRLPGVVEQLQRASDREWLDLAAHLTPLQVRSADEIGEVAAAFNAVHEVAIQIAAEQAALRLSVADMFLNLARRSQALINRQLKLIDELEQEADMQALENLFKLDHLATRMRRNAENLIVLSGAEPPRRWAEPILLEEVVQAAIAEVEDYQRVELVPVEGVAVPGHAAADVIHLLAELIENATSFSPPGTTVSVACQPAAKGYVVVVEDRGLGMSDEELTEANERLANPPSIDSALSRRLGLFVVGRLAQRHGIKVQLRRSSYGGIIALVLLPPSLITAPAAPPALTPAGHEGRGPGRPPDRDQQRAHPESEQGEGHARLA